jgi:uncharacterized protein (TIGR03083 family)
MVWLDPARYDVELDIETARLGAVASELEPQMPVPTCPKWRMWDLVTHVGTGHRWATQIVEGRFMTPAPYELVPAPADPAAWVGWLTSGARQLADAVQEAGPERPVWTWRAERTAGFWLRKMVHDELVHRFDVEIAAGRLGTVAPDLAADGVSDLLASIATLSPVASPDPVFAGLVGTGQTLMFLATDADASSGAWLVERTPAGVTWQHRHAPADVTVRAPARELLLVMNRRLDPTGEGVEITGDTALFTHWLKHSQF